MKTQSDSGKRAPDVILDTNVLLQLYSIHDVSAQAARSSDRSDPEMRHRLTRQRDALLFGWLCHSEQIATGSLQNELVRLLRTRVPPAGVDLEQHFTTTFLYFVKDYVLDGWLSGSVNEIDDRDLVGNDADDALLEAAKQAGLPLVTDEGNSPGGLAETNAKGRHNLRGKAREDGVPVFTPGELCRSKGLVADRAEQAFLERFDERRAAYVADWVVQGDSIETLETLLDDIRGTFEFVFRTGRSD